ncbi:Holliday junction branch migration DNA helicase RuvB [Patescibacteria group bacterium]|nr:Holliday junction branch migration DNA helicase RuvB [Patescibacteria group bacterium]
MQKQNDKPQNKNNEQLNGSLRPKTLEDYFFGGAIKNKLFSSLKIFLQAARERKEALDHVLFYGPPGLGKTTLAHILAQEMNVQIKITSGPAIERTGDLASILTNLEEGDILFIDEIHRLNKAVEETMYPAMEDFCLDIILGKGPSAQTIRLDLPRFTIVGATTRAGLLSAPLRGRFGVTHRLDFFNKDDLTRIAKRSVGLLDLHVTPSACEEIAKCCRGTPRIVNHLIKRVRDYSQVKKQENITSEIVREALKMLEVDDMGLNKIDQMYLDILIRKFQGGPVGLSTLCSAMAEDPGTLEDVIEPFLLQKGLIKKTTQGRVAAIKAYEHLGVHFPNQGSIL